MWILPLIGYIGLLLGFLFLTLAIASGLYYLSELVEEHTRLARLTLTRLIYITIFFQTLLLLIDRLPLWPSLLSIASHVLYLQNLRRFPWVKLTDPVFLGSCVAVLVNHWVWYRHFSPTNHATQSARYNYYDPGPPQPSFSEIASFFGLQVWLVPFALFVSLSAGENVLPSMGSEYATGAGSSFVSPGQVPGEAGRTGGRKRAGTQGGGMAKMAVGGVKDWIGETGELLGVWKGERTRPL